MHELSLAVDLMRQIEDIALQQGIVAVRRVELHVGAKQLVVPEAMQEAFREVAKGTVADAAQLDIVEIPMRVRCQVCGRVFEPSLQDFRCPDCQQAEVSFLQGHEILLASLECDVQDESSETRPETSPAKKATKE